MAPVILAPEIVQRIIYFLIHDYVIPDGQCTDVWGVVPGSGPKYAAVNRIWQDEIERESFASLRLDLKRLLQVNSIVIPRRRRYIRTIKLDVALPRSGPVDSPETDEEKLRNNRALQATFEAFMQSMSQWDAGDVYHGGVRLYVNTSTPHDVADWRLDSPRSWKRQAKLERRRAASLVELTDADRIIQYPPVVAITEYKGNNTDLGIHISAVATCVLLSKLPAVKQAFIDWWRCSRFPRIRTDLSAAISQINHSIDDLDISDSSLTFGDWLPFTPPPASSANGPDELSRSLRMLSQRLKTLDIYDIAISDELFFPRTPSLDMEPRWDRLVKLNLHYLPVTYSGEYLFLPDPNALSSSEEESDSDDSLSWDDRPREEPQPKPSIAAPALHRFHLAVARAALQMPVMQRMTLIALLEYGISWHKFRYSTNKLKAKALWTSSSEYVPDDELLDCWRKVPRKNLNMELEVEIVDDESAI